MRAVVAVILFVIFAVTTVFGAEPKIYISGALKGESRSVSTQEIESILLAANGSLKEAYTTAVDKQQKTKFEGVGLNEFIDRYGAQGVQKIVVKAWDGYSITIDKEVITKHLLILATRENGKHISYKQRGPARVVTGRIQSETEQLIERVQIFAIREIIFIK